MEEREARLSLPQETWDAVAEGADVRQVHAELVRALYQRAPTAIFASWGVALLVFGFSWRLDPPILWLVWLVTVVGIGMFRLALIQRFRRRELSDGAMPAWELYFNLGAFLGGCSWGFLAFMLDVSWPVANQVLVYVTLLGVSSGALGSNGVRTATFMLFATPMIAPIALLLARVGDGSHVGMSALVSLYLIVLYYTSVFHERSFRHSQTLQLRNAGLLESLSRSNRGLQEEVEERRRAELALSEEKERAETTLHSITDAVITTGQDGLVTYLNPVAEKLTGWTLAQAEGRPLGEIFILEEIDPIPSAGVAAEGISYQMLRSRDGGSYVINHTRAPLKSASGQVQGTVLVFQDVTQMRNMARELAYRASHDALTGLINRREFELLLHDAIGGMGHGGQQHVLVYLDLDQFKVVNDTCGHRAGDELLRQVARLLEGCLRQSDIIARLGGDEFGVLLRSCPLNVGIRIAELLRGEIRAFRFSWDGRVFEVGVSVGVVPIISPETSPTDVLSQADIACYTAKDLGRNRVHVYEEKDDELSRRKGEMQWISRITRALEEDRLILYYQEIAQVNGKQGGGRHFEILLRMSDEEGTIVPPSAFLPAAERYNLMPSLDRWVIEHAFDWCSRFGEADIVCSINLSGTSLNDAGFPAYIRDKFKQSRVPPQMICFEITETAVVANLGAASRLMQELRVMGCSFALDDFGSGLSSFAYLKNLPVDFIKIDGAFVRDIVTDPVEHAMVSAINKVGQVMGKQTIAEYVETTAILEALGAIGVDFVQGYAVGKPAPLDGVPVLLGRVETGHDAALSRH